MSAYPEGPVQVMDFKYKDSLLLTRAIDAVQARRREDSDYVVAKNYRACAKIKKCGDERPTWFLIEVPQCFLTDLSSAPRCVRWYVSRAGPHLEASIVHDWLFVAWQKECREPNEDMRKFADDVFLEAMRVARVGGIRRRVIYKASRLAGASLFYEKDTPLFSCCSPSAQIICNGT